MKKLFLLLLFLISTINGIGQTITRHNSKVYIRDVPPGNTSYDVLIMDGTNFVARMPRLSFLTGYVKTSDLLASNIIYTPYLTIGSTNMQAAFNELKDEVDALVLSGAGSLDNLSDVTINGTPVTNEVLIYGGSVWGNRALAHTDITNFAAGVTANETTHTDVLVDGDFVSEGLMKRGATTGLYSIITDNSANWDTAYGWGNHATAGYLSSFTETDPQWGLSPSFGITGSNITNWNLAFSWGNHALEGYVETELDPVFSLHPAFNTTGVNTGDQDLTPYATKNLSVLDKTNYTTLTNENNAYIGILGGNVILDATGKTPGYNQIVLNNTLANISLTSTDIIRGENNPIPPGKHATYVLTDVGEWTVSTPTSPFGTETDPYFTSWAYDYNDLINKPNATGITTVTTNFNNNLTTAEDTVQKALDKIDDIIIGAGTGNVESVNTQTGVVVLDTDDISDATQTNKYVTAAEKTKLANLSGVNTGDQDVSIYAKKDLDIVHKTTNYTTNTAEGANYVILDPGVTTVTLDATGKNLGFNQIIYNNTGISVSLFSSNTIEGYNNAIPNGYHATYILTGATEWTVSTPVEGQGVSGTDDQVALEVPYSPSGNIASTNVQALGQELQGDIDVRLKGTISDNQVAIGTGTAYTLEGNSNLTWSGILLTASSTAGSNGGIMSINGNNNGGYGGNFTLGSGNGFSHTFSGNATNITTIVGSLSTPFIFNMNGAVNDNDIVRRVDLSSFGGGTVTSVTAGNGMTQTGTSTINPTLNVVSHAGTAGSIGTINIGADAIGVNLGTTNTTAAAGNHAHGSITNTGYLGTTPNLPLITGNSGVIQAGAFGTAANTFAQGNDSRFTKIGSDILITGYVKPGTATPLAATDNVNQALGKLERGIEEAVISAGSGDITSVGVTGPILTGGGSEGGVTITHATGSGYNHVPAGGASGNWMQWLSAGTGQWAALPVDPNYYVSGLSLSSGILTATRSGLGPLTVDLSPLSDGNNFPSSMTFNTTTNILTLARTDLTDLTVNLSTLKDGAGTVTSVGDGTGFDVATSTTTPAITLDFEELAASGTLVGTDKIVTVDGTVTTKTAINTIPLSIFSNNLGWTSNTGTVTTVGVGSGLDIANPTTTPNITVNFSEFTTLSTGILTGTDFAIVQDGTTHNKIAFQDLSLNIFKNDLNALNLGDVSGVINFSNAASMSTAPSQVKLNLLTRDFTIQDNATSRFTFGRTTGNFTATGDATVGSLSTAGVVTITNATASTSGTTGALKVTGGVGVQGSVWAASYYENSLRALKTDITPFLSSGLDIINSLDIVNFDLKDGSAKNKIGVIIDDSPKEIADGNQTAVSLYNTIFVQAKAIQELSDKVDSLEKRIEKLEALINE